MTTRSTLLLAVACLAAGIGGSAWTQTQPAATAQSTFPKGDVTRYTLDGSKIFPGTTRDFWIYVPKQYDPAKPACLYVNQDAVQFNAPAVFDQLIAEGKMPVTIGVFVQPGRVKAPTTQALDRLNRSYEFDGMSDEYARFLLDELLPEVEKKTAPDNRPIRLSKNPDDRAIGGASSGAICAFTAAWERNDSFHRVFSSIGTYVDLRGGNVYPTLIRKYEPKAIRIFLEDGSADNNSYGGDWWMANQEIQRALTFAGYEVNHKWGTGGHNAQQATAIFGEAMTWLWKDYPTPVSTGLGSEKLKEILIPGQPWKSAIPEGIKLGRLDGATTDIAGNVYFCDMGAQAYKISADGNLQKYMTLAVGSGQAFGPDSRMYALVGNEVQSIDSGKSFSVSGFRGNDLVIANNGNIYATESGGTPATSQVWLVTPKGEKKAIDTGLKFPNGITLSPDQALLYVADYRSHWVYSYQIQPDGTLANKQKFYNLYVRDVDDDAGGDGIRTDRDGRLYVATRAGIQVCDTAGRVNCIIPTPNGRATTLTFGGADMDMLYVLAGDKVYVRKLKVKGTLPFAAPIKAPTPRQ